MASLDKQRQLGLFRRLAPLFQYFFLDGLANGFLHIPMALYITVRVLDENPQRMAMFAMLSTLVYQVPRIPVAVVHGEIADRMPRKGLIFLSKVINIFLNLIIVLHPRIDLILCTYFLQACFNIHSFSEQNYLMDLTMYLCPGLSEQLEARSCESDPPWLMTKTIKADNGIKDVQRGGIASGFFSGMGRAIGQVSGTLLIRQRVLTIRLAIYLALLMKFLAQFAILPISETKSRQAGSSFFSLLYFAVLDAKRSVYFGWEDQRARWQAQEAVLNNLTKFFIVSLTTVCFYGTIFLLVLEYKLKPTKQQRIDIALALMPCIAAGFVMWYYHQTSMTKGEIFATPYYTLAITCAMATGAFVSTYTGFLGILGFLTFCSIPVTIPLSAMWPSQASIRKQGRLRAITIIVFLTFIVIPSILIGVLAFVILTGRIGGLERHDTGSRSAKQDLRVSAALFVTSIANLPSSFYLKKMSYDVRLLIGVEEVRSNKDFHTDTL